MNREWTQIHANARKVVFWIVLGLAEHPSRAFVLIRGSKNRTFEIQHYPYSYPYQGVLPLLPTGGGTSAGAVDLLTLLHVFENFSDHVMADAGTDGFQF